MTDVSIPLAIVISIGAPVLSAMAAAIVWLARGKHRAEEGRLSDLRASGAETRALFERVIPLLERSAARSRSSEDHPLSVRPSATDLEKTLAEMRAAEEETERARRKLNALTTNPELGMGR